MCVYDPCDLSTEAKERAEYIIAHKVLLFVYFYLILFIMYS